MKKLITYCLLLQISGPIVASPAIPPNYSSGVVLNHWLKEQQLSQNSSRTLNNPNLWNQPPTQKIYFEEGVLFTPSPDDEILLCPFNCNNYLKDSSK